MGFFDKLKSIKNAVTGGSAKVFLSSEYLTIGEPFEVTVRAEVADAPLKIDRVYLKIVGSEEIEVPDVDVIYDEEGDVEGRRVETVRAEVETVSLEIHVADGEELEANGSYEWKVEVQLPPNAQPIFRGKYCQHTYAAFAGLDAFGNDPDSGWVELS